MTRHLPSPSGRLAVLGLIALILSSACGGDNGNPLGPTDYVVAGTWYFSEELTDTRLGVSCSDSGPVAVTQNEAHFSAIGVQSGACTGPAGTQEFTDLPFTFDGGTIDGTRVQFSIDNCPYIGRAYGDVPDSVAGTVACRISAQGVTINLEGSWVVGPITDSAQLGLHPGPERHYTSNGIRLGKTLVGDLNGDGLNDVAAEEAEGGGRILLYYQNQAGGLDAPIPLTATNLGISKIAIGDLNHDGRQDLAVSGSAINALSGFLGRVLIYYQNPATGGLLPPVEDTIASNSTGDLAIGDLNHDGYDDLLVTAEWMVATTGRLSIRYQQAGGTLGPEVVYDSVLVDFTGEVHIADVTGDGLKDIILQDSLLDLAVVSQNANGTLSITPAHHTVQTSYWPRFDAFAVGDFNGDGRTDIVVDDPGNSGTLNFFTQSPGGALTRTLSAPLGIGPFGLEIADINRDGLNDILGDNSATISVFYQTPAHAFPTATPYFFQTLSSGGSLEHQSLAIGDVTGDGRPDVVVTWLDEGLWVLPTVTKIPPAAALRGSGKVTNEEWGSAHGMDRRE
jgi:hypothetical protein